MSGGPKRTSLHDVESWAYQIQGLEQEGAIQELVDSEYDMVVIEPTRSSKGFENFDTRGMVERLHSSRGIHVDSKIVIAYVDIGQAEDWRIYWNESWIAPTATERGDPDFLVSIDPDGWSGDYPVAYWDTAWKEIVLYGDNSLVQQVLDDGFDGIYLDWVDGFSYEPVVAAAEADGLDAQQEMIDFIREIREFCLKQEGDFIVIPQNALDICEGHPEYFDIIDAVAQEHILFDGNASAEWGDPTAGDVRVPAENTDWYVEMLQRYQVHGKVAFTVDYALKNQNIQEAYAFAANHGFIEFVTQIPLSRLPVQCFTRPAPIVMVNIVTENRKEENDV